MLNDIAFALWFMLPAAVANATPIFSAVLPGLRKFNAPIDGGRMYKGHRILGSHKTWRGIITGIVAAVFILWLQKAVVQNFEWATFMTGTVDYNSVSLFMGIIFAVGALGGDAFESFLKRRKNIESGRSWLPFDQLDYIVGTILITLPFILLTISQYAWIIVIWFIIHIRVSFIGYKVGLKEYPI